jgi:hypothetical protein
VNKKSNSFRVTLDVDLGDKASIAKRAAEADNAEVQANHYRKMLADAVRYAKEDRMVTPGSTRLARLLARAEAAITKATP